MRVARHVVLVTTGVIGLIGSALAADMTGEEIKTFLSGKTSYLETTTASASGQAGNAAIYWNPDGTALYKAPDERRRAIRFARIGTRVAMRASAMRKQAMPSLSLMPRVDRPALRFLKQLQEMQRS